MFPQPILRAATVTALPATSTYAVVVLDLAESGRRRDALLVVSLSVVLGLALAFGEFQVGRAL